MNSVNINLRGLNVTSIKTEEWLANKTVTAVITGVSEADLPADVIAAASNVRGNNPVSPAWVALTFVVDCDKNNPFNTDAVKKMAAARDFAEQFSILANQ